MKSQLKHYKMPISKAKVFLRQIDECSLANMGYHDYGVLGWVAYHHHDSGTTLVVEYDPEIDKKNAIMQIRGLEERIVETLNSLNILNLEIIEDN